MSPDRHGPRPEELLPLSPPTYHVLLALGESTLHGYGIMQVFGEMTGGAETLLPGSLYATIARMLDAGLVEEAPAPEGESSGGRPRRYYRTTPLGRSVARAETARLSRLVELARKRDLAPETR